MELPVIVKLAKPVMHGEEEVRELKITRPVTAKDFRGITVEKLTFDDLILLGSRLTGYPPSVIGQLSIPDFTRLNNVLTAFFADGQETGS